MIDDKYPDSPESLTRRTDPAEYKALPHFEAKSSIYNQNLANLDIRAYLTPFQRHILITDLDRNEIIKHIRTCAMTTVKTIRPLDPNEKRKITIPHISEVFPMCKACNAAILAGFGKTPELDPFKCDNCKDLECPKCGAEIGLTLGSCDICNYMIGTCVDCGEPIKTGDMCQSCFEIFRGDFNNGQI